MPAKEHVVAVELGVTWEPNAPEVILTTGDWGVAAVAINAHPSDADQSSVVLFWKQSVAAVIGPPNDEARQGHRLYTESEEVHWVGEVIESEWVAEIERRYRAHHRDDPATYADLRHLIFPLKENTIEIVAHDLPVVRRLPGTTSTAALAAIESTRQPRPD